MKTAVDDITSCCENENVIVTRVLFFDPTQKTNIDHTRGIKAFSPAATEYKALSKRFGNTRRTQRDDMTNGMQFKARPGRQILSTIGSLLTPGDITPYRSPVRSAIYRTITPGVGGGRRGGSRPGENRAQRCPEGYQYGGRFTDNRFTTCGAKLFAIPSILGAAIAAIRRATTGAAPPTVTGRIATGVTVDSSIIQSREPQIPRVGNENKPVATARSKTLTKDIGGYISRNATDIRRMVRRDGFVLEPVVANSVLRAIPDNRDMEGATFLLSTRNVEAIGGDELGLLSNTGIQKLMYILPGGSTLTLEKARKLSVGERRKLGRVVNSSMEIDNSKNPTARLQNVSNELQGAIAYSENFIGISNPTQVGPSGRPRWANELLSGKKVKVPKAQTDEAVDEIQEIASARTKKKITNIDNAVQHLANNGSISDIDPSIIGDVINNTQAIKRQKISDTLSLVDDPSGKYFLYEQPGRFQHMGEMFAADLQRYLGLAAPAVIPIGKPGERRQYLRQDVEMAIPGGQFDPAKKFTDLDPEDVARIMISDFLTDQRARPSTSIYPVTSGNETRAVLAQNTTSGLTDLSKIEITERIRARLRDFYSDDLVPSYSEYYQQLKSDQRIIFIRFINQLLQRARSYNPRRFFGRDGEYGMSEGEKIHLNILTKLFKTRLNTLSTQKQELRTILTGGG